MLIITFYLQSAFVLLIKGADLLVEGAASIAKKLKNIHTGHWPNCCLFGTSAPELIVNLLASLQGNTEIAIGNVLEVILQTSCLF